MIGKLRTFKGRVGSICGKDAIPTYASDDSVLPSFSLSSRHFIRGRGHEARAAQRGRVRPLGREWCLLAGDETALPAIERFLKTLPHTGRGVALIEGGRRRRRTASHRQG
ncbi:SIP domain-containing protein [Paenirhodobacter sp.]|uniref:SIP domain-containing protein n=1 Tax=Paenirhodobacter sp. TaxID=1965326 RepID=UPI003B500AD6